MGISLKFSTARLSMPIVTFLVYLATGFSDMYGRRRLREPGIVIEAGAGGWQLIEYKELFKSAQEYFGAERVSRLDINPGLSYLSQVRCSLRSNKFSHRLYDPRTGSQRVIPGFFQALSIAFLYSIYGVTPICALTDFPIARQRFQVAVVSARRGVTFTLMQPKLVGRSFPHRRLIGPMPMALSAETVGALIENPPLIEKMNMVPVAFVGSLYEPRIATLRAVAAHLERHGIKLEVIGRDLKVPRGDDTSYWSSIRSAQIVITTADQRIFHDRENLGLRHLVYRYFEVLAVGSLLVGQVVPGLGRFLVEGEHFVGYDSPADAAKKIQWALNNPSELERISRAGQERCRDLVQAGIFWQTVETGLGQDTIS